MHFYWVWMLPLLALLYLGTGIFQGSLLSNRIGFWVPPLLGMPYLDKGEIISGPAFFSFYPLGLGITSAGAS
jgi:hypothetical protein